MELPRGARPRIAIVTWPILKAGIIPLQGLVNILETLSSELYIITGGAGNRIIDLAKPQINVRYVYYKSPQNSFIRIINNLLMQIKISWKLAMITRKVEFFIFFFGGPVLLLPMLTAYCLRKKVILNFTGSETEDAKHQFGQFVSNLVHLVTKINCTLSTKILLSSETLVTKWHLEKYRGKICIVHRHFLDTNTFYIQRQLKERNKTVGFIGRLSQEKGALEFIKAVKNLLEERPEINVLVGGDGHLKNEILQYISGHALNNKVQLAGWIDHAELPNYLNNLKLLVLPSYTEELPNIMLEAMACGTPVLATPTGSIPDIIKEGETGFLMENNSPECIGKNILRALYHPNLEEIANNGRKMVENAFTFRKAVESYGKITSEIFGD